MPRVQLITPDDLHKRCPKHVEFRDKNFGYLMHLVGYLYEAWHFSLLLPRLGYPFFACIIVDPLTNCSTMCLRTLTLQVDRNKSIRTYLLTDDDDDEIRGFYYFSVYRNIDCLYFTSLEQIKLKVFGSSTNNTEAWNVLSFQITFVNVTCFQQCFSRANTWNSKISNEIKRLQATLWYNA